MEFWRADRVRGASARQAKKEPGGSFKQGCIFIHLHQIRRWGRGSARVHLLTNRIHKQVRHIRGRCKTFLPNPRMPHIHQQLSLRFSPTFYLLLSAIISVATCVGIETPIIITPPIIINILAEVFIIVLHQKNLTAFMLCRQLSRLFKGRAGGSCISTIRLDNCVQLIKPIKISSHFYSYLSFARFCFATRLAFLRILVSSLLCFVI